MNLIIIEHETSLIITNLITDFIKSFPLITQYSVEKFQHLKSWISDSIRNADWIILTATDPELLQQQIESIKKDRLSLNILVVYDQKKAHSKEWDQFIGKNAHTLQGLLNASAEPHIIKEQSLWFSSLLQASQKQKNLLNHFHHWKKEISLLQTELSCMKALTKNHIRQHIPMRYSQFGNIEIVGQFSPGDGPGGEFIDTIENQEQISLLITASSSYELNSHLLVSYSELKQETHITLERIEQFIFNLFQTYPKAVQQLQILFGLLAPSTMIFEGYNLGGTKLITSEGEISISSDSNHTLPYFQCDLKQHKHLLLLSPGFQKGQISIGCPVTLFQQGRLDMIDNLFFMLNKQRQEKTAQRRYDATVVVMGKMS